MAQRFARTLSQEAGSFLARFAARYSARQVMEYLEKARGMRVLFLGEAIIDEYQYCETMGKSGKEPVLAVRYLSTEKFAGGIMATANHAAAFCDHVGIISLLGTQDSHEEFIREKLDPKIDAMFLYMPGSPTIVKRRLVETYPFQKLFEVYTMEPEVPETVSQALHARLKAILPNYDAVVVTDYGHGMMTPEIVDLLCGQDRFLAINTQTNAANQGFNTVSKYAAGRLHLHLRKGTPPGGPQPQQGPPADRRRDSEQAVLPANADHSRAARAASATARAKGSSTSPPSPTASSTASARATRCWPSRRSAPRQAAPTEMIGFIGNVVGAQAVEIVGNRSAINSATVLGQIESFLHYDLPLSKK